MLIDSGAEAAVQVASLLTKKGLRNIPGHEGSVRYYVSDSTENFTGSASVFLQHPLEGPVERIDIEKY